MKRGTYTFFLILLIAGIAVAQPQKKVPIEPATVVEKTTVNPEKSIGDGSEYLSPILGFKVKITDALLALFTGLLSVYTARLYYATKGVWGATENLVLGAEDTTRRQLRAYVHMEAAAITNVKVGGQPKAKITIRNSGKTPAHNMVQWSNMGFDHFPPKIVPPDGMEKNMPSHPLAPNGAIYATPGIPIALTAYQIDGLTKGEVAIYVVGGIRYDDVFGVTHTTTYRVFAGGPIGIDTGAMSPWKEGNKAD